MKRCLVLWIDDWEKINETSLPEKEDFYSHLNMEDVTNTGLLHAKRVCKDFEEKELGRVSWLVCSKRYIIVSRYIWELLKYIS